MSRPLGASYWRLWFASVISNLGDGVATVAYPWLASALTRYPVLIALVSVVTAGWMPMVSASVAAAILEHPEKGDAARKLFADGQEFSYDLEEMARYYRGYVELMDHWDRVLPGFVLRVQHEEVVDDLEGVLYRLRCPLRDSHADVDDAARIRGQHEVGLRTRLDLEERVEAVRRQSGRRRLVVDGEGQAVEADKAVRCRRPQIAVACLEERQDRVLRQPVVGGPVVDAVLRRGGRGH